MKHLYKSIVLVLIVTSMLLAACTPAPAPATQAPQAPQASEATQAPATPAPAVAEPTAAPQASAEPKVFRWGSSVAPAGTFNALLINDVANGLVTNVVYENLVKYDEKGNLVPWLATSWDISEDLKTVTWHLRDGVKWNDGTPFTAADVKFSYEFIASPGYTGQFAAPVKTIVGFDEMRAGTATELAGVKIIDDLTLSFTTKEIYAEAIERLGNYLYIIAKHQWEGVPLDKALEQTEKLQNPVGTGPYMVKEYVPDSHAIVEANPHYWGGEPKIDEIIFQVVNQETAPSMISRGELDYIELNSLSPEIIKSYEDAGATFIQVPTTYSQLLVLNNQSHYLQDVNVRRGIYYAIDRPNILENIAYGYGRLVTQPYPPFFWAYGGDDKYNPYDYSPETAIKVLTEDAGWKYENGTMYDAEGEPVVMKLIYPQGNKARELAAVVIQQNLKEIGIQLDITMLEFNTMLAAFDLQEPEAFEMGMVGTGVGKTGSLFNAYHTSAIFNGMNMERYSDPEMDKLLEESNSIVDRDARKEVYVKVSQRINETVPQIFLYNYDAGRFISPRVQDYVMNADDNTWMIYQWDLAPAK